MSKDHEVMFYTDGRHTSVYLYEPPMGVKQYVEPIDELVDLGIDTITYAVGDCSVLLYSTKVGERWGHNVDLTDNDIWWRAAHNARLMIDSGADPLMLVCEHAKRRGFQFFPSLLLNMVYTPHDRVTNCRVADFTTEHPEWRVGDEPEFPEARYDNPDRLSFAVPEVRDNRLAVIAELLRDYPADGIELNMRDYAPFIGRAEVAEYTETMTAWMRDIRRLCDEAAADQDRDKRLVIRVGATLKGNGDMGMDVESWIKEGIVDTVIAMQVVGGFENDTSGLREVVAGAGGVHFHTYYPMPKRYPYDDAATGQLRFMGHPDLLGNLDKTYRLGIPFNSDSAPACGLVEQLPAELTPGEPARKCTLEVSDDIAGRSAAGELWRCELRVLLQHLTYEDTIELTWNGEEIPASEWRKADWTYQLRPRPDSAVNAYRLHVDLVQLQRLPMLGVNAIGVAVVSKDAQLVHPVTLAEVSLVVEYLPHRNALRADEDYHS